MANKKNFDFKGASSAYIERVYANQAEFQAVVEAQKPIIQQSANQGIGFIAPRKGYNFIDESTSAGKAISSAMKNMTPDILDDLINGRPSSAIDQIEIHNNIWNKSINGRHSKTFKENMKFANLIKNGNGALLMIDGEWVGANGNALIELGVTHGSYGGGKINARHSTHNLFIGLDNSQVEFYQKALLDLEEQITKNGHGFIQDEQPRYALEDIHSYYGAIVSPDGQVTRDATAKLSRGMSWSKEEITRARSALETVQRSSHKGSWAKKSIEQRLTEIAGQPLNNSSTIVATHNGYIADIPTIVQHEGGSFLPNAVHFDTQKTLETIYKSPAEYLPRGFNSAKMAGVEGFAHMSGVQYNKALAHVGGYDANVQYDSLVNAFNKDIHGFRSRIYGITSKRATQPIKRMNVSRFGGAKMRPLVKSTTDINQDMFLLATNGYSRSRTDSQLFDFTFSADANGAYKMNKHNSIIKNNSIYSLVNTQEKDGVHYAILYDYNNKEYAAVGADSIDALNGKLNSVFRRPNIKELKDMDNLKHHVFSTAGASEYERMFTGANAPYTFNKYLDAMTKLKAAGIVPINNTFSQAQLDAVGGLGLTKTQTRNLGYMYERLDSEYDLLTQVKKKLGEYGGEKEGVLEKALFLEKFRDNLKKQDPNFENFKRPLPSAFQQAQVYNPITKEMSTVNVRDVDALTTSLLAITKTNTPHSGVGARQRSLQKFLEYHAYNSDSGISSDLAKEALRVFHNTKVTKGNSMSGSGIGHVTRNVANVLFNGNAFGSIMTEVTGTNLGRRTGNWYSHDIIQLSHDAMTRAKSLDLDDTTRAITKKMSGHVAGNWGNILRTKGSSEEILSQMGYLKREGEAALDPFGAGIHRIRKAARKHNFTPSMGIGYSQPNANAERKATSIIIGLELGDRTINAHGMPVLNIEVPLIDVQSNSFSFNGQSYSAANVLRYNGKRNEIMLSNSVLEIVESMSSDRVLKEARRIAAKGDPQSIARAQAYINKEIAKKIEGLPSLMPHSMSGSNVAFNGSMSKQVVKNRANTINIEQLFYDINSQFGKDKRGISAWLKDNKEWDVAKLTQYLTLDDMTASKLGFDVGRIAQSTPVLHKMREMLRSNFDLTTENVKGRQMAGLVLGVKGPNIAYSPFEALSDPSAGYILQKHNVVPLANKGGFHGSYFSGHGGEFGNRHTDMMVSTLFINDDALAGIKFDKNTNTFLDSMTTYESMGAISSTKAKMFSGEKVKNLKIPEQFAYSDEVLDIVRGNKGIIKPGMVLGHTIEDGRAIPFRYTGANDFVFGGVMQNKYGGITFTGTEQINIKNGTKLAEQGGGSKTTVDIYGDDVFQTLKNHFGINSNIEMVMANEMHKPKGAPGVLQATFNQYLHDTLGMGLKQEDILGGIRRSLLAGGATNEYVDSIKFDANGKIMMGNLNPYTAFRQDIIDTGKYSPQNIIMSLDQELRAMTQGQHGLIYNVNGHTAIRGLVNQSIMDVADYANTDGGIVYRARELQMIKSKGTFSKSEKMREASKIIFDRLENLVVDSRAELGNVPNELFRALGDALGTNPIANTDKMTHVVTRYGQAYNNAHIFSEAMQNFDMLPEDMQNAIGRDLRGTVLNPNSKFFLGTEKQGYMLHLPESVKIGETEVNRLYMPIMNSALDERNPLNQVHKAQYNLLQAVSDYHAGPNEAYSVTDLSDNLAKQVKRYVQSLGQGMLGSDGYYFSNGAGAKIDASGWFKMRGQNALLDSKLTNVLQEGEVLVGRSDIESMVRNGMRGADESLIKAQIKGALEQAEFGGPGGLYGMMTRYPIKDTSTMQAISFRVLNEEQEHKLRLAKGLDEGIDPLKGSVYTPLGTQIAIGGDNDGDHVTLSMLQITDKGIDVSTNRALGVHQRHDAKIAQNIAEIARADMMNEFQIAGFGTDSATFRMGFKTANIEDAVIAQAKMLQAEKIGLFSHVNTKMREITSSLIEGSTNDAVKHATMIDAGAILHHAGSAIEQVPISGKKLTSLIAEAMQSGQDVDAIIQNLMKAPERMIEAFNNQDSQGIIDVMHTFGFFKDGYFVGTGKGQEGLKLEESIGRKVSVDEVKQSYDHYFTYAKNSGLDPKLNIGYSNYNDRSPDEAIGKIQKIMASVNGESVDSPFVSQNTERLLNDVAPDLAGQVKANAANAMNEANRGHSYTRESVNTIIKSWEDSRESIAAMRTASENFHHSSNAFNIVGNTLTESAGKVSLGLMAVAASAWLIGGITRRPNADQEPVQTQKDTAPSSDGTYVDPSVYAGAPRGAEPKAYLAKRNQGYERTTIKINARSLSGATNDEIAQYIQDEITKQTPYNVNFTIESQDDRKTLDKRFLRDQFAKVLTDNNML